MTDKDFAVIADILLELRPLFREDQFKSIISVFAKHLSDHYPPFHPEKFRRYIETH